MNAQTDTNPLTIRDLRRRKNFTQQDLAERAGIGRVTLSRIESGLQEPEADTRTRLARALEVSDDMLLFPPLERPRSMSKESALLIQNQELKEENARLQRMVEKLTNMLDRLVKNEDAAQPGAYGLPLFAIEAGNMRGQHPGGAEA